MRSRMLIVALFFLAQGCTYEVDSLVDAPDANPGDFVCAREIHEDGLTTGDDGGLCTLRAAIEEANATGVRDTIIVPPGEYNLVLPAAAGGGLLEITEDVDILGSDAAATIIDAGNGVIFSDDPACNTTGGGLQIPVLYISGGEVFIRGVTLRGGADQFGGGLRIDGGTVEMRDAVVRENFAFTGGAGVLVGEDATATLLRTTIGSNCAIGAFGGGIFNEGTLWVHDSTIAENESNRAGGIYNEGQLNLRNVTVSGNIGDSPLGATGGIAQNAFAVLNNVTVTDNVGTGSDPSSFMGGGIQTFAGETTVMKNSIVAENTGILGPDDCQGALSFDSKHNLIGNSEGCEISGFLFTYLLDVSPGLGGLSLNGGPTRTHALLGGSPAVNAAYPFAPGGPAADACEGTDQRGVPRPQGAGPCDMGAFEVTPAAIFITGFVLVDAAADTDIRPLLYGDTLDLSELPPQLSVRTEFTGVPASVVFGLDDNATYQTENALPYALGGDNPAGDYLPVAFTVGTHILIATPFAGGDGSGPAGGSLSIVFEVQP